MYAGFPELTYAQFVLVEGSELGICIKDVA